MVSEGQENRNFGIINISDADLIENGKTIGSQLTITKLIDEIEGDSASSENETLNIDNQVLDNLETAEQSEILGETSLKAENDNNLQNQSSNLFDSFSAAIRAFCSSTCCTVSSNFSGFMDGKRK